MERRYHINDLEQVKNRGEISPRKKKSKFGKYKNNTINSLLEVECFLNDFSRFSKYMKLYKLLK